MNKKYLVKCPRCNYTHFLGSEIINPDARRPKFIKEILCFDMSDSRKITIECLACGKNFSILNMELKKFVEVD
jgi:predicted nucleic-acid-binding Zn-ribbon protein